MPNVTAIVQIIKRLSAQSEIEFLFHKALMVHPIVPR